MEDARRTFWLLLAGFLLLHVVLAVSLPVSGDEAYYWDCSRHPDWSYFDQPPLVIWAMIPARAVFGDTRLAVRAPAILSGLLAGLFLLGLVRRLGGGYREAAWAYAVLHAMPLFFLGAFYTSTDIAMATAYLGATWAAAALAAGEERAWWGFGVAVGLGFLAKFPVVIVLPALLPALMVPGVRRQLRTPVPWAAGALSLVLTAPVWIWGARHHWDNITFQLAGRHGGGSFGLKYLGEFIGANLLLATPFVAAALAVAWWRGWRRREATWRVAVVATTMPFVFFGLVALRERVGAHWGGPGLVVAAALLAVTRFRWRRGLVVAGAVMGVALCLAAGWVVANPEKLVGLEWSYRGRPHRISTKKLAAVIGNREIMAELERRRAPGELVASESYTNVHLFAFLSKGKLPTRLAHVKPGKHGLASLYWYTPDELRGRDVLFVTVKRGVDEALRETFAEVVEGEPIEIVRGGRVVRSLRTLRCRDLLHPEGVFTRLGDR